MSKFNVVALGELLIDFTNNGMSAQGNPLFEANPGGILYLKLIPEELLVMSYLCSKISEIKRHL